MPCVYLPGPAPAMTVANRDNKAKNELYVQSTADQEHFKRVKNMGCLRLNFLLPAVSNSGESIF